MTYLIAIAISILINDCSITNNELKSFENTEFSC